MAPTWASRLIKTYGHSKVLELETLKSFWVEIVVFAHHQFEKSWFVCVLDWCFFHAESVSGGDCDTVFRDQEEGEQADHGAAHAEEQDFQQHHEQLFPGSRDRGRLLRRNCRPRWLVEDCLIN